MDTNTLNKYSKLIRFSRNTVFVLDMSKRTVLASNACNDDANTTRIFKVAVDAVDDYLSKTPTQTKFVTMCQRFCRYIPKRMDTIQSERDGYTVECTMLKPRIVMVTVFDLENENEGEISSRSRSEDTNTTKTEKTISKSINSTNDDSGGDAYSTTSLFEQLKTLNLNKYPAQVIRFLHSTRPDPGLSSVDKGQWESAQMHSDVAIIFIDIVDFTQRSARVNDPRLSMQFLTYVFTTIDVICEIRPRVCKVETAGDCYVAAVGLGSNAADSSPKSSNKHQNVVAAIAFARDVICAMHLTKLPDEIRQGFGDPTVRIGIHVGEVISCVMGAVLPKFAMFGSAMNIASRMQSLGFRDSIHISEQTYKALMDIGVTSGVTSGVTTGVTSGSAAAPIRRANSQNSNLRLQVSRDITSDNPLPGSVSAMTWCRRTHVPVKGLGDSTTYLWTPIPEDMTFVNQRILLHLRTVGVKHRLVSMKAMSPIQRSNSGDRKVRWFD